MEETLLSSWNKLKGTKLGRWVFSRAIGFVVPYSGSVLPDVQHIEPGMCTILLRERRRVRNHLKSIHAIALANVGELASGLAMLSALPIGARGIVKKIEIEYYKKSRGTLRVEGSALAPGALTENIEALAIAEIFDESSELVSKLSVTWVIGPKE